MSVEDDFDPFMHSDIKARAPRSKLSSLRSERASEEEPRAFGVRCGSCRGEDRMPVGDRLYVPINMPKVESVVQVVNTVDEFYMCTEALRRGRVPAIGVFYADWCKHCKEYKELIKRHKEHIGEHLVVVMVNYDSVNDEYSAHGDRSFEPNDIKVLGYPTVAFFQGTEWGAWSRSRNDFDAFIASADKLNNQVRKNA